MANDDEKQTQINGNTVVNIMVVIAVGGAICSGFYWAGGVNENQKNIVARLTRIETILERRSATYRPFPEFSAPTKATGLPLPKMQ